ncbi:YoaK family protein [Streptomyces gibsoniae]|uniref:YoaK family protein n=1 Tax=Streptomyces gibsoniae TaxID=3075529 RepID=A0ABU2TQ13_9ACTN|nr:YoaK family protein [Streptomyces sp. DSM 41699]MDT0462975.1 YoaK family protein [Streptomyces sp. DSM 41699]
MQPHDAGASARKTDAGEPEPRLTDGRVGTLVRERPHEKQGAMAHTLHLGALLALTGGALDAYGFIRYGVFTNAQTGNFVLLAISAARGRWQHALRYAPPILAFVGGVLTVEALKRPRLAALFRHPQRAALVLEVVVLAGVGLLPGGTPDLLVTALIVFTSSVQFSAFRTLVDTAASTTMTTANLRTAAQNAYLALVDHDREAARRARHFLVVIGVFLTGALAGAWLTALLGTRAIWIAAALVAVCLFRNLRDERQGRAGSTA